MNIDRIAREMVDIEPSRDLEARIRARLDAARPERPAAWLSWRIAAPLAVAAAIAIALIVVQRPESTSLPAEAAAGAIAQVGPASQLPNVATSHVSNVASQPPTVRTSEVTRVRPSRLSRVPASVLSSEELAWMERRMPALEPMVSIQPEPLGITPLTMTPVATDSGGIERRNDR